VLFKQARILH